MSQLRFLVSLITQDNDYQREQAASARAAAHEFGVNVEIVFAGNDAITQSTQLLKAIQADASLRPDAIVVEPLGATPFPKVASTAAMHRLGRRQPRSRLHHSASASLLLSGFFHQRGPNRNRPHSGKTNRRSPAARRIDPLYSRSVGQLRVPSALRGNAGNDELQRAAREPQRKMDRRERLPERFFLDETHARAKNANRYDQRAKRCHGHRREKSCERARQRPRPRTPVEHPGHGLRRRPQHRPGLGAHRSP